MAISISLSTLTSKVGRIPNPVQLTTSPHRDLSISMFPISKFQPPIPVDVLWVVVMDPHIADKYPRHTLLLTPSPSLIQHVAWHGRKLPHTLLAHLHLLNLDQQRLRSHRATSSPSILSHTAHWHRAHHHLPSRAPQNASNAQAFLLQSDLFTAIRLFPLANWWTGCWREEGEEELAISPFPQPPLKAPIQKRGAGWQPIYYRPADLPSPKIEEFSRISVQH